MSAFYLTSYPKSGNTWARLLLLNYFNVEQEEISLNQLPHFTIQESSLVAWERLGVIDRETHNKISDDEIAMPDLLKIRNKFQKTIYTAKRPFLVKNHSIPGFPGLPAIIDLAYVNKCLYIVRDPRDVVISHSHFLNISYDLMIESLREVLSALMSEKEKHQAFVQTSTWSNHFLLWAIGAEATNTPFMVIRYEDMLKEPEEILRLVLKFYGLRNKDINPEQITFAVEASAFDKVSLEEKAQGFIEASEHSPFFRKGTAGQWVDQLTFEQIAIIEKDHEHIMRRLGYLGP